MPELQASHPVALLGDSSRVLELLETRGALAEGHFRLLSGMHTDRFFRFSKVAEDPHALDEIADWLVPGLQTHAFDSVLAPTTAGVGLGWTLANAFGVPLHLAALDDEGRPSGVLGEPGLRGRRVLLVNDLVTTGRGLMAMADLVADRGGEAAAASWFLTRSDVNAEAALAIPCISVAAWHLPAWGASGCAACSAGDQPEFAYDLN